MESAGKFRVIRYGFFLLLEIRGALWHRPRGPDPVKLGLLAKDAICPTHLVVVGARNSLDPGPVRLRQEAKRGARRRRRRDRWRDHAATAVTCVFLTPPGLRGTKSQE